MLGEVHTPGRYTLEGPTTVMQAIALAGSWNVGANLKELVVFRRDDCWRLMATKVNVFGALFGHQPCPGGEIWLRDSDIVLCAQERRAGDRRRDQSPVHPWALQRVSVLYHGDFHQTEHALKIMSFDAEGLKTAYGAGLSLPNLQP